MTENGRLDLYIQRLDKFEAKQETRDNLIFAKVNETGRTVAVLESKLDTHLTDHKEEKAAWVSFKMKILAAFIIALAAAAVAIWKVH